MRGFVFPLVFLIFESAFGQEEAISIRPAGVTLIWEKVDQDAFEHVSILHSQKPVAVALYLTSGAKKIVSIDRDASKLSSLTDDQGTKMKGRIGYFPDIAKNGSGAFVSAPVNKLATGSPPGASNLLHTSTPRPGVFSGRKTSSSPAR